MALPQQISLASPLVITSTISSAVNLGTTAQPQVAQSFTGLTDVQAVAVTIGKTSTPTDNLTVEIRSGSQTGTLLGTSAAVAGSAITSGTEILFTFSGNGVTGLSASTTYWFVLKRSGATSNTLFFSVNQNTAAPYAGGTLSTFNGSTWTDSATDMQAKIHFASINGTTNALGVGPFKSSGGKYYVFSASSIPTTVNAFNSSAPDTAWAFVANKTGYTTGVYNMAAYQVGDVIHMVVAHGASVSTIVFSYLTFDMATDAFVLSEVIQAASNTNGVVWASIVVRGDGNVVVSYTAAFATVMSVNYNRVSFKRRTAVNTWGTATALDANASVNYSRPVMCLGASDRVHIFFIDVFTTDHRSLSSANVLTTVVNIPSIYCGSDSRAWGCISYVNGANTKIVLCGESVAGGSDLLAVTGDSSATTTFTAGTPFTITGAVSVVLPFVDGTTLYALFGKATDATIYITSSTNNGSTWSSATLVYNATFGFNSPDDILFCATLYQRGSNYVTPYGFFLSGSVYNEYTVRTTGPTNYTMAADPGSFTVSGKSVLTPVKMPVLAAAFALTGNDAILTPLHKITAVKAAFAVNGSVANLQRSHPPLAAVTGTFALTGNAVLTPVSMPAVKAAFTIAGSVTKLVVGRGFAALTAPFTLNGFDVNMLHGYAPLAAATGAFTTTGVAVTFKVKHVFTAAVTAFNVNGSVAGFKRNYAVAAATGSFAVTGVPINLATLHTYSIASVVGSFAVTGIAPALRATRILLAAKGAFNLAGVATALRQGHVLIAATGAVAVTGVATQLRYGHVVQAASGSFVLSGNAAVFPSSRAIGCAPAAFTATGVAAALRVSRRFEAVTGPFLVSGIATALRGTRITTAVVGNFAVTGTAAGLRAVRQLAVTPGNFSVTGVAALLRYPRTIPAVKGVFSVNGVAASLVYSAAGSRTMPATVGAFTVNGLDTTLHLVHALTAQKATFTVTRNAANLIVVRNLTAVHGSFNLNGAVAALVVLRAARTLPCDLGAFTINGVVTPIVAMRRFVADTGVFTLTGATATLLATRRVVASTGAFTLNGVLVKLRPTHVMMPLPGTFTVNGAVVNLVYSASGNRTLLAQAGSFLLTGVAAQMSRIRRAKVLPGAFTVSSVGAGLKAERNFVALPGVFAVHGVAANLVYVLQPDRRMVVTAGIFTVAANDNFMMHHKVIPLKPRVKYSAWPRGFDYGWYNGTPWPPGRTG